MGMRNPSNPTNLNSPELVHQQSVSQTPELPGRRKFQSNPPPNTANLRAAIDQLLLIIEELPKGKASVGFREGTSDTVYFAENLKPRETAKLVEDIAQGKIDLNELCKQEWREVEGGLTSFFNSVGEVATETAISVVSGILGGYMVTRCGPVGAITISLGVAAAVKKSQETSVGPGILGGTLFTLCGPVGAIVIPLGVAAAVKLLPDKMSHE